MLSMELLVLPSTRLEPRISTLELEAREMLSMESLVLPSMRLEHLTSILLDLRGPSRLLLFKPASPQITR